MRLDVAAGWGGEESLRVEAGELQQAEFGNHLRGRSPSHGERGLAIVSAEAVRGSSAAM
jgi:hypothetical protein